MSSTLLKSRVIKLRAWDKNENKMLYFDDYQNPDITVVNGYPAISFLSNSRFDIRFDERNIDDFEITQSTGLYTKSGVEIYEGDILKNKDFLYKFVYEYGSFVCLHLNEKYYDGEPKKWGLLSRLYDTDMVNIYNDIEVIGNIFKEQIQ